MNKEEALDKFKLVKEVRFCEAHQVLYPVGEDKDAFYIISWLQLNPVTLEVTTQSQAVKNWTNGENHPKYKLIHDGSYLECYNAIRKFIEENY